MYSRHAIKLRSTSIQLHHSEKKLAEIERQKEQRLPQLLRDVLSDRVVLYLDECVYTSRTIINKVYRHRNA